MSSTPPEAPSSDWQAAEQQAADQDAPLKIKLKPAQAKRANATIFGMLMATLVCLGLALIFPLLSAHPSGQLNRPDIDATAVAFEAAQVAGFTPLAPRLPSGWKVNYARWNAAGSDGVGSWEIGYTTANQKFVQLIQTAQANPTWLSAKVDGAPETGQREVAGTQWKLRDKPGTSASLVTSRASADGSKGTTVLLRAELPDGTNNFADLDALAAAITH